MSVFNLPPAYPALLPPGTVGAHHEPGCCQFCGLALEGRSACPMCGSVVVDCRPVTETVPCAAVGCVGRGVPGVDAHEVWDGWEMTFWCERHCPECNGATR